MSLRHEFVALARDPDANVSALCRRFAISRKTGYKWIRRFEAENGAAFRGLPVALRPTGEDGRWTVFFCDQKIREIDLRDSEP